MVVNMNVQERMRTIRLMEKLDSDKEYAWLIEPTAAVNFDLNKEQTEEEGAKYE